MDGRKGGCEMKRLKIILPIFVISFIFGLTAASVQAKSILGQWSITFYNDATDLTQQATQSICFVDGPEAGVEQGTWYSTTFSNWHGHWWRKQGNANVTIINGNFFSGSGNDGAKVEFINGSTITGSWVEWTDSGSPSRYQVRLLRTKTICDPPKLTPDFETQDSEEGMPAVRK